MYIYKQITGMITTHARARIYTRMNKITFSQQIILRQFSLATSLRPNSVEVDNIPEACKYKNMLYIP